MPPKNKSKETPPSKTELAAKALDELPPDELQFVSACYDAVVDTIGYNRQHYSVLIAMLGLGRIEGKQLVREKLQKAGIEVGSDDDILKLSPPFPTLPAFQMPALGMRGIPENATSSPPPDTKPTASVQRPRYEHPRKLTSLQLDTSDARTSPEPSRRKRNRKSPGVTRRKKRVKFSNQANFIEENGEFRRSGKTVETAYLLRPVSDWVQPLARPYVGSWQCSLCDSWSSKYWKFCKGTHEDQSQNDNITKRCKGLQDKDTKMKQAHDVKTPKEDWHYGGDWLCRFCGTWNTERDGWCNAHDERLEFGLCFIDKDDALDFEQVKDRDHLGRTF